MREEGKKKRGKTIPGEAITLNGDALIGHAKEEQSALREELKAVLDELTYSKLAEQEAAMADAAVNLQSKVPLTVFVG